MHTTTVAYLGPAGTFTEQALYEFADLGVFSGDITPLPVASPAAALDAVRSGSAQYAVVAIENSVDGAVTGTYDALLDGDRNVQIFHEHALHIAFSIMVRPGTQLEDIKSFATHPVAHQQVRGWLKAHLPSAEFIPASSNAAAAEMVAQGKADAAAAPARAADLFGLESVATGVNDSAAAHTRFVVVGKRDTPPPATGTDTTLVAFTLPNEPGTLVGALQDFSLRGVDLSRIASRPNPENSGTYRFYVDVVGHIEDIPVAEALRALWLRAEEIYFLGSWKTPGEHSQAGDSSEQRQRLEQATQWVRQARTGKA